MSDLISRQAVLDELEKWDWQDLYLPIHFKQILDDVPSVENKGKWIAYDHGMGLVYLKCPFCGVTIDKRHVEHNFCGKCGAKLCGEKSGFEM